MTDEIAPVDDFNLEAVERVAAELQHPGQVLLDAIRSFPAATSLQSAAAGAAGNQLDMQRLLLRPLLEAAKPPKIRAGIADLATLKDAKSQRPDKLREAVERIATAQVRAPTADLSQSIDALKNSGLVDMLSDSLQSATNVETEQRLENDLADQIDELTSLLIPFAAVLSPWLERALPEPREAPLPFTSTGDNGSILKTVLSRLAAGESVLEIAQSVQTQVQSSEPGTVPVTTPRSPTG